MRDWTEWVKEHLPLDDFEAPAARSMVEEVASLLEEVYRTALALGRSPEAADAEARAHIEDWDQLAADLARARGSRREGTPHRAAEWADERLRRRGHPVERLADLLLDVRRAARSLRRTPVFTAAVVLLLGLGVGANAAIFSVLEAVALKPLPYPEPERVVTLWSTTVERDGRGPASFPDYLDWRRDNRSFEAMGATQGMLASVTEDGVPMQVRGARATASLFDVFEVAPAMGRRILPDEDASDARVVVLSYDLWTRLFSRDPDVLGKTLRLSGEAYVVVGVMPKDFVVTSPWDANDRVLFWTPFPSDVLTAHRDSYSFPVYARLRDGVSLQAARNDMERVALSLADAYPATNRTIRVTVSLLHAVLFAGAGGSLFIVLGAALLVLLIACGNVAGLLLARGAVRRREVALRAALGASRGRIIRELLTESGLLAVAGGAMAMVLVVVGVGALRGFLPATLPRVGDVAVDGPVLGLAMVLSLLTALVFGLAPALQAARVSHVEALKEGSASGFRGRRGLARRGFVVAQLALTLMLLHGTVLLVGSYVLLRQRDQGFNPDNVLTASVTLAASRYDSAEARLTFFRDLLARLDALPGVRQAAAVNRLPFEGGTNARVIVEGRPVPPDPNDRPLVERKTAVGNYLSVMGIPLLAGRTLEETDASGIRGVVINQRMADRLWPDEDPLGKHFAFGAPEPEWLTVVGVATNVSQWGPEWGTLNEAYRAYPLYPQRTMYLALKTDGPPARVIPDVRRTVLAVDPDLPLTRIRTGRQLVSDHLGQREFTTTLIGIFAVLALVLTMVGIYGIISYFVAQNTHDLGVRMALGAGHGRLLRYVLGKGLVLAGTGAGVGALGAYWATRVTRRLLFGISPTSLWASAGVVALILAAAILATWIPARRAARVDPARALQAE
ncbi:MAG: ABC transporter permease [Gemmatimonadetes bacterium]|nr:ABC transporter permease [Gemmatimonadota bacterium]